MRVSQEKRWNTLQIEFTIRICKLTVVVSYVTYKFRGYAVMINLVLAVFAWHFIGGFIAHVSNNAFGLPISMNTLVIIVFCIAIFLAGAVWFFTKMSEGFFE